MTKLILALDMQAYDAYKLVEETQDIIDVYKITHQFMISAFNHYPYSSFLNFMRDNLVFIDFKLYDTPDTMVNVLKEIQEFEPFMVTVHSACDTRGLQEQFPDINLLGVSILTSFGRHQWYRNKFGNFEDNIETLLKKSSEDKLSGVVTDNVHAVKAKKINPSLITVCPGFNIKGLPYDNHDKINTVDKENVDYVVVGRAITESDDPVKAINLIRKSSGD